jgi:hypothetical protein
MKVGNYIIVDPQKVHLLDRKHSELFIDNIGKITDISEGEKNPTFSIEYKKYFIIKFLKLDIIEQFFIVANTETELKMMLTANKYNI